MTKKICRGTGGREILKKMMEVMENKKGCDKNGMVGSL